MLFRAPETMIFLHISSYLSLQLNCASLSNIRNPISYIFCYFAAKILRLLLLLGKQKFGNQFYKGSVNLKFCLGYSMQLNLMELFYCYIQIPVGIFQYMQFVSRWYPEMLKTSWFINLTKIGILINDKNIRITIIIYKWIKIVDSSFGVGR